jgi:hypothetical protein
VALRVREEKRYCEGEESVKEQGFDEECRLLYMRRNREYKEWYWGNRNKEGTLRLMVMCVTKSRSD